MKLVSKYIAIMAIALLLSWIAGCGKDDSSVQPALADGTWDLAAPHCLSSDARPVWPSANARAALYDFDALTERSLTVAGRQVTEVWTDEDCKLTAKRTVHTNTGDFFSLKQNKSLTWSPPGCVLQVTAAGETTAIGEGSTAAIADSARADEDVPWRLTLGANGWVMISLGQEPVANIWSDFGCMAPDSLVMRLQRR